MKYPKIFYIDFVTHYKLHNTSMFEYKLSGDKDSDKLIIQSNYRLFLERVKIDLLDKAVVEGLFDKTVKVSFEKISYSKEEKEKALYYLECEAVRSKNIAPVYAHVWAEEKYKEYNPFNVLMVIETKEDENEIY